MWPFRKKRDKKSVVKKVVVGLVIGTAIASIVGKKMMDKHEQNDEEERE